MNFHTIDTDTMTVSKIYDEKELSDAVFNSVQYYRKQAEHWKKMYTLWRKHGMEQANDELKDEIEALQKQLDMSYGQFASKKEKEAYDKFSQDHMHDRLVSKLHGGMTPYLIPHHCGIGTTLKVKCQICGEEKNITDTEVW